MTGKYKAAVFDMDGTMFDTERIWKENWERCIVEFGFDCKVRKLSDKTVANYQKQLRYVQKYLKEEFQITEVEEIKSYHIKQFLAMMDDKHRKPRYINDLLKVVKTFLNYSS